MAKTGKSEIFSEDEKQAMKEYVKEQTSGKSVGESAVLEKIREMSGKDRELAERIHKLVKANAPELTPKTWYGMPAYATKDGKVVCFFQGAGKFKSRYATLGFSDTAKLDDGDMWATAFAVKNISAEDEKKIISLINKAIS